MKTLLLAAVLLTPNAQAAPKMEAALDAAYKHLRHPKISLLRDADSQTKNDVLGVIAKQSPVKSQAARGSCSIFSATALLESMMIISGKADPSVNLSEEWLQYVIAQHATSDGSDSVSNFAAIHQYGMPSEAKLPYIGLTWAKLDSDPAASTRCAGLQSSRLAHCLTGHRDPALLAADDKLLSERDPEFLAARQEAASMKASTLTEKGENASGTIDDTNEIKALLDRGIPITLDITFFYGAWNHRLAESMDINRNMDNWEHGIVGYPEEGSNDSVNSFKHPAGHSVVLVGYDDEREVSYESKMQDGTTKKFTRKGVYYFKNSWGTEIFGTKTEIDGQIMPGYGMITQDYANEKGQFFKLEL